MGWFSITKEDELLTAATKGNANKVKTLLIDGADVNAKKFGMTALMYAVEKGNV